MTNLVASIKAAIGQRQATVEQARQQAESELFKILARCAKPKSDDDVRLLKLADDLNITPERLAVMAEVSQQASELLAASDDGRLKKLGRAALAAEVPVNQFNAETKKLLDERQSKLDELEEAQRTANAEFRRGQDALNALNELANGAHAELLKNVFGINAETLPKGYHYTIGALNERDGKPW